MKAEIFAIFFADEKFKNCVIARSRPKGGDVAIP